MWIRQYDDHHHHIAHTYVIYLCIWSPSSSSSSSSPFLSFLLLTFCDSTSNRDQRVLRGIHYIKFRFFFLLSSSSSQKIDLITDLSVSLIAMFIGIAYFLVLLIRFLVNEKKLWEINIPCYYSCKVSSHIIISILMVKRFLSLSLSPYDRLVSLFVVVFFIYIWSIVISNC